MPSSEAIVAEVANELATWPGVSFERGDGGATLVRYEQHELGWLYPERGVAEIPVLDAEHDELIEHGDAEPGGDDRRVERRQPRPARSVGRDRGARAVRSPLPRLARRRRPLQLLGSELGDGGRHGR